MKFYSVFFSFAIFFSNTALAESNFPNIRPGLWETQTLVEGEKSKSSKACVDEKSLKTLLDKSKEMLNGVCTGMNLKKLGKQKYAQDITCDLGVMNTYISTSIEGDFEKKFSAQTITKMVPALNGKPEEKSSSNARFIGSCPKNMKPGDIILANGKK